jgi:hypothetical protein
MDRLSFSRLGQILELLLGFEIEVGAEFIANVGQLFYSGIHLLDANQAVTIPEDGLNQFSIVLGLVFLHYFGKLMAQSEILFENILIFRGKGVHDS